MTSKSARVKSVLDSLNVMLMVAVAPILSSVLLGISSASGSSVSTLNVFVLLPSEPSVFWLPAALVNLLLATLTTPLAVLLAVGVKVAV